MRLFDVNILAAFAIESGSTWVTGDRDYGLFKGLERVFIDLNA